MLLTLRGRFTLWAIGTAVLLAVFFLRVANGLKIETDILAILPTVDRDAVVEHAVHQLADVTGRRTLFLVGARDAPQAESAAKDFASALEKTKAFARVSLVVEYKAAEIDALYGPHRSQLLSSAQRASLAQGQPQRLVEQSLRALYTPSGWLRLRPFADDPLDLYGSFLAEQIPAGGSLRLQDGMLAATGADGEYILVTAESADSPFSSAAQDQLPPAIDAASAALKAAHPDARVLVSGVIRHAAANAERAQTEISAFGSVSLAGIVLLVLATFRALRPLALALGCLSIAGLASLTACWFLFDKVHIITLVFGSTLFGVAVDYSIHFFADQFRQPGDWDAEATYEHVAPAVFVGMLATVLGYVALLLPPFPGLRQMAVFSIAGVAVSSATVLMAYPLLVGKRRAPREPALLRFARRLESLHIRWSWQPRTVAAVAAVAALTAAGLARLRAEDDIRQLVFTPAAVAREEAAVQRILGSSNDTRFFLVRGATAEAVAEAEEGLRAGLDALVQKKALTSYQAISRARPSLKRQAENHRLQAQLVYAKDGALPALLRQVGYPPAKIGAMVAAFPDTAPAPLTLEQWLASPAAAALRSLWLGDQGDMGHGYASAVVLGGVQDVAALRALATANAGVRFVDRVADISDLMGRYRRLAAACLAGAYAIIGALMMLRYGALTGARLIAPPVLAAAITLALLGLAGQAVNLFNVLALLLVLGMGVDYSVFMREGLASRATVIMAILLAGFMTLLSFGMLAFSATPFIRSIGLTLVPGVVLTFVLALVCVSPAEGPPPTKGASPAADSGSAQSP